MAGNISKLAKINYDKGLADADSVINTSGDNYKAGVDSAKRGMLLLHRYLQELRSHRWEELIRREVCLTEECLTGNRLPERL